MSISKIQKTFLLEEIAKYYFLTGEKPLDTEVINDMSSFFADNTIGLPFNIDTSNFFSNIKSDTDKLNDAMLRSLINMSILYEAVLQEMERSMSIFTSAATRLENLKIRRNLIETDVDDFLLALNNTAGYFYSFTDTFSTLKYIDTEYTSAFIDVDNSAISIPHLPEMTTVLPGTSISLIQSSVIIDGSQVNYVQDGFFESVFDGLSNTSWSISTKTNKKSKVTLVLKLSINGPVRDFMLSRIAITPQTVKPMRIAVETESSYSANTFGSEVREPFGRYVPFTANSTVFIDEIKKASTIYITMEKDEPDYELYGRYEYVFGISNLEIMKAHFDQQASFVSKPISLPEDLKSDHVIDTVSVSAEYSEPADSSVNFFIAVDDPYVVNINDFEWKPIILESSSNKKDYGDLIKLKGAQSQVVNIVENPSSSEIQLIEFNNTDTDLSKRNPTSTIVDGVDIYRIGRLEEKFVPQTIKLEEGINTLRTLVLPYNPNAVSDLSIWADYVKGVDTASEYYTTIDTGNGFFYGGNLGQNYVSVYAETYLESPINREAIIKNFTKSDGNSKQWDVKVWLNGRNVADMPKGVDSFAIPWQFDKGFNHIAITANIPASSTESVSPYLGVLDIMVNDSLDNYGVVKLANWSYVDSFHMKYNESGQPFTFTIYNNEIVSRRKPTSNFRIRYSSPDNNNTSAIRIRADMHRADYSDSISPSIKRYSVKFSYGAS